MNSFLVWHFREEHLLQRCLWRFWVVTLYLFKQVFPLMLPCTAHKKSPAVVGKLYSIDIAWFGLTSLKIRDITTLYSLIWMSLFIIFQKKNKFNILIFFHFSQFWQICSAESGCLTFPPIKKKIIAQTDRGLIIFRKSNLCLNFSLFLTACLEILCL